MANYNFNPYAQPYPQHPGMGFMQQPQIAPTFQAPQQPQPVQQTQNPSAYMARLVTCREEAVAAQILDGTPWAFIDEAHGMVYTKRFNPYTNAADFHEYRRADAPQQAAQPQFVTLDTFSQLVAEVEAIKSALHAPTTSRKTKEAAE